MKFLKKIFKPALAVFVIVAIGAMILTKKGIIKLKIKPLYKNVYKINERIQKLYLIAFNPYRIPNGIRPDFSSFHESDAFDIARCHETIRAKRSRAAFRS